MAKSPDQMMNLFRQFAEQNCKATDLAIVNGNVELAAFNLGQMIKSMLMQGMIAWRARLCDPTPVFLEILAFTSRMLPACKSLGGSRAVINNHLLLFRANYLAYLLGTNSFVDDIEGLEGDVLLDCVLSRALNGQWDADLWTKGLDGLQKYKSADLAVKTYMMYHDLLHSNDYSSINRKVLIAIDLFDKRKTNAFFSGGDQTNGGGFDNAYVVDYRLAAILKKLSYTSNSIHDWLW